MIMGSHENSEHNLMIEQNMDIDPKRARFPCCIVWTPLPFLSWLIPFIGHVGICREDGVILDFAGPNFVCVDNFTFGAVARYLQINKCCDSAYASRFRGEEGYNQNESGSDKMAWDEALQKGTQEYQHRAYNLLTCNCHSFVANNLNRLGFQAGGWNVVNLAIFIFLRGQWVSKATMVRSHLPFIIVAGLGLILGGMSFLIFLAAFNFLLVGWFLVATFCFRNLIAL